jgi:hypothetical protein
MATVSLIASVLMILISAAMARREFNSYFNPWFFFFGIEVCVLHGLAIFSANALDLLEGESVYKALAFCSALYIFGYSLSYWIRSKTLSAAAAGLVSSIPNLSPGRMTVAFAVLFLIFGFMCLVVLGDAGLLWFTDPRLAYLNYRGATGDGALFVFAQWMLTIASAICLFVVRTRITRLSVVLIFLCAAAYFFGSKQILLNLIIYAAYLIDRQGYKLKLIHFGLIALIAVMAFVTLLGGLDDTTPLVFAGIYFSEYAVNTARIFSPEVQKSFSIGEIFFSNAWTYLPRFLFPEKPFEYGQVLINSILFPGAAEMGQTPGLLYWSGYYVDFGFVGVLFYGLLRGMIDAALFSALRRSGEQPLKLALFYSMCVTPLFLYAPVAYQFVFVLLVSRGLRIFNKRRQTTGKLIASGTVQRVAA